MNSLYYLIQGFAGCIYLFFNYFFNLPINSLYDLMRCTLQSNLLVHIILEQFIVNIIHTLRYLLKNH